MLVEFAPLLLRLEHVDRVDARARLVVLDDLDQLLLEHPRLSVPRVCHQQALELRNRALDVREAGGVRTARDDAPVENQRARVLQYRQHAHRRQPLLLLMPLALEALVGLRRPPQVAPQVLGRPLHHVDARVVGVATLEEEPTLALVALAA